MAVFPRFHTSRPQHHTLLCDTFSAQRCTCEIHIHRHAWPSPTVPLPRSTHHTATPHGCALRWGPSGFQAAGMTHRVLGNIPVDVFLFTFACPATRDWRLSCSREEQLAYGGSEQRNAPRGPRHSGSHPGPLSAELSSPSWWPRGDGSRWMPSRQGDWPTATHRANVRARSEANGLLPAREETRTSSREVSPASGVRPAGPPRAHAACCFCSSAAHWRRRQAAPSPRAHWDREAPSALRNGA